MDAVIRTRDLTKRYGEIVGVESLDLEVPRGVVFGYLGPNGAGKTTTIRILAGLMRPTRGHAQVLGLDTVERPDAIQARVGYLPGSFVAYGDLTGRQYLRYLANLRGTVPWPRVEGLASRLELDLSRRIGALSHGNRQKVGLIQAFMHDPDLLILDEPTSGLDPLIQQQFLGLVREAREAGKTVFLSSHVLDEVEAVADTVAILRGGRLIVVEQVDSLKLQALRRIELVFDRVPTRTELEGLEGVREVQLTDSRATVVVEGSTAPLLTATAPYGIKDIATHEADLEEIFLTYYASEA